MSYKPYDKYQAVDNIFFKKMPQNWSIFKLKFLIDSLESGKRKDFEDANYAFSIGGEHLNWNGTLNLKNERYLSEDFYNSMTKGKIHKNDTLLVKDGATIGKTAFVDKLTQRMAVNEHVFIIRNNSNLIPKLLYYLISSQLGFTQIKLTETGSAQGGISQDIADKVNFIIPLELVEQNQIVKYLDKNITKINTIIAKNEELIQLLEEKRVALINHVVTKGLNPDVPLKESEINIMNTRIKHPSSWNLIKIKYLLSSKVTDGPHETPEFIDEGYPFLSVDSIVDGKLVFEGCRYISEEDYNKYKLKCNPQKDDVFMGKAASIGKIAIVDVDFNFSIWSPLALLRSNQELILPKYLEYSLKSDYAQDQIDLYSTSNTQKNISMDDIPRIELIIPPIEQQKDIIEYLEKEIGKIETIIIRSKENIELLEEYKTSLIHHVVTGRIDVRGEKI